MSKHKIAAAAPPEVELEIEKLVYGAYGLARAADGKVYFIEGALPGDRVRARLSRSRKDWDRGWVLERRHDGEPRNVPPCPFFMSCGGCTFQDVPLARSLELKREMVAEVLQRLGGFDSALNVLPTVPCPAPYRYRRRAQLKATVREDRWLLGFFRRGTHHVVEADRCEVLLPTVDQTRLALMAAFAGRGFGRHDITHLRVNATAAGTGVQVVLSGNILPPDLEPVFAQARERVPALSGFVWESYEQKQWGDPTLEEIVPRQPGGELRYRIGFASFFQVNAYMDEILFDLVSQAVAVRGDDLIFDLYSGVGTFSLRFAREGARVVSVEGNQMSVADARANVAANGLSEERVRQVCADAEAGMAQLCRAGLTPRAIFLDPSRAGASTAARDLILAARPERIVYLSCNAATLARDLRHLTSAYQLERVTPIDLFPQTAHVEVLAELSKK